MNANAALVLGLGVSGDAAARLLRTEGRQVVVLDRDDNETLRRRAAELVSAGIEVLLGTEAVPERDFGLCVVSPGVPADSAMMVALRGRGVPAIGEFEFGAMKCHCPIVAVTGANGKSTMVKLCGDILRLGGCRVELGGNYGTPLSAIAPRTSGLDWVVAEASSFQLETAERFRPRVGVLMNLQPNHLDRHPTLAAYRAAKARMFACMGAGDWAIVHESVFSGFRRSAPEGARNATWVKFGGGPRSQFRYVGGAVRHTGGAAGSISVEGTYFDNPVLGPAAAAAAAVAVACGVSPGLLVDAARHFVPLAHRMTRVATVRGVNFVDDSKATTLAAMAAGVQMSAGPVRLIAGGLLKEHSLDGVKKVLASRVRAVYLIGSSAPIMGQAWGADVTCLRCDTLDAAVARAWQDAEPGDTVLLSPGCASFDQFRGYADRGEQFCRYVAAIEEGVRS